MHQGLTKYMGYVLGGGDIVVGKAPYGKWD